MLHRFYLLTLLFTFTALLAQQPAKKDPFFKQNQPAEGTKVKHIHSNKFGKNPDRFEGNITFEGDVQFEHQGSNLSADLVIWYEADNFVRAIGNVKLTNPDGSVITAGEMEYDGNTQRGLARKNVVLQDNTQRINTEVLYYDRISNQAYYNTGGTITREGSTMYTRSATYYIGTKMIDFTDNVNITNTDYTVEGKNIKVNQITNTAEFFGPTTIRSRQNPSNYVYTEQGRYLMSQKEVYLNKNSAIYYNGKILTANQIYYNQLTGFGRGQGDVLLRDPREKRFIRGEYGEIFEKKDSAMLRDKAYAVKILEKDSMFFSAQKILSYQKPDTQNPSIKKNFLRAFRQARFYKSNAQARADSLSFNETDGTLSLFGNPILWSGAKQVSGDRLDAFFNVDKEYIDSLHVTGNAFAISKVDSLSRADEFHQVRSKMMSVYYVENEIKTAKAIGNAESVAYLDDYDRTKGDTVRIGVGKSSCGIMEALFEERQLQIISCNIGAKSDIYPMSLLADNERFLATFSWNTRDRPRRWQDILVDSPGYPEETLQSVNPYREATEAARKKAAEEAEAKKPKRIRKSAD